MKLQILSDLHLEFGMMPVPHTDADVVIAAGDIHLQEQGVEWLKSFDKPVIYICGNHEYWRGEWDETQHLIREACADSNVHFLECESVDVAGVRFHGCTLWTDYADGNQWLMEDAESRINDFKYIRHGEVNLRADDILRIHRESLTWLQESLKQSADVKNIVVTHHAPSQQSWHRASSDAIQFAYCNDMDEVASHSNASLWVHGHVHASADYRLGETRVVCNPRGYHGMAEVDSFDPDYVVEI